MRAGTIKGFSYVSVPKKVHRIAVSVLLPNCFCSGYIEHFVSEVTDMFLKIWNSAQKRDICFIARSDSFRYL